VRGPILVLYAMELMMSELLKNAAPGAAQGSYADGYEAVARCFAAQLAAGEQIGAGFTVYRRGACVVDLWGGVTDVVSGRPWERDTRIVLFSVTKGLAAMALHMLADRGLLDWGARVADYWPNFARGGKGDITVSTLLNHRAGLAALDARLTLEDCTDPSRAGILLEALESQAPAWRPGEQQGYHATTFGMYARELFERVAGEPMGDFLRRELFEPLGSDVWLGTPAEEDARIATLYPPAASERVVNMLSTAWILPESAEAGVFKQFLTRGSPMRAAFLNPHVPGNDVTVYNRPPVRRSALAWASATGSAHGLARAYLPFASRGEHGGRRYVQAATLEPVYRRQGWAARDLVLQKPLGWSHGFLKEERHLFSPNPESFGHAGMGGALGWADPIDELTIGYAMNRMDWRVRSARCVALCRALYESDALVQR
jgi:CubicO group peptidase (beta-lactamase class C family)